MAEAGKAAALVAVGAVAEARAVVAQVGVVKVRVTKAGAEDAWVCRRCWQEGRTVRAATVAAEWVVVGWAAAATEEEA